MGVKEIKVIVFYRNGDIHEFTQEGTDEQIESIADIVNTSFMEGVNAVIRLNNDTAANMIRLSDVSRVTFEQLNNVD